MKSTPAIRRAVAIATAFAAAPTLLGQQYQTPFPHTPASFQSHPSLPPSGFTQPLPTGRALQLPGGALVTLPPGWTPQPNGPFIALVPPVNPASAQPAAIYSVMLIPGAGQAADAGVQGAAVLNSLVASCLPSLSPEGVPEASPPGDPRPVMRLRFSGPTVSGVPSKAQVVARNLGGVLIMVVGIGPDESLQTNSAAALDIARSVSLPSPQAQALAPGSSPQHTMAPGFAGGGWSPHYAPTATPPPQQQHFAPQMYTPQPPPGLGSIDPQLLGTWRSSTANSDSRSGATMATETIYHFNPDGTFLIVSRAAAGNRSDSYSTGFQPGTTGIWSASEGVLTTVSSTGQQGQVRYLFHNGSLVFKRDAGGYVFWYR